MKICKIADKIVKTTNASGYIVRGGKYGTVFAEFCPHDWRDYEEICAKAERINGAAVESYLHSHVIRVWTAEDYEKLTRNNAEAKSLVDGFWETLHSFGREAAGKYFNDHAADYARLGIA